VPNDGQPEQQSSSSLYRRHRPRTFAEVVGQEPVVRTLRNAVDRDRVHHAYLFVGSRGTGKTSMAKILAACLNCERGPTVEPCGECESCVAIARASSLDVIEMDAASNNSVDDVRELRESVALQPLSGRRKVYILDEAHMLSTAAWNAFLKTLEEPPPGTVFVLATTEAQKVPATVIDRCQRFDFQRPTVEQIAEVVRRTAASESIEIPPEAIAALARAATGSFRDALGTLEQLLAYSGSTIALEDVLAVLGVADGQLLERTVDAVAAGDARGALLALGESTESGRDGASFAADLEARARELLVVQTLDEVPSELALTPDADARLLDQARRVPHEVVVHLLDLIAEALESVRAGADPRTSLELALVKAAKPELDASTKALLARVERLERGGVQAAEIREAGPSQAPGGGNAVEIVETRMGAPERPADPPVTVAETQARVAGPPVGEAPAPADPPAAVTEKPDEESPPAVPAEPPAPVAVVELTEMVSLWPTVVELVSAGHALCGAVIADAIPVAVSDRDLTVGFPAGAAFLKKKAEDPANRTIVAESLRELTGGRWRVSYELRDDLQPGGPRARAGGYSEEEWIERFKSELDAEELPVEGETAGETAAADDAIADETAADHAVAERKEA
jgi:DNA polymerase III subunit gamma/tau